MNTLILTPAYGRDYRNKKEVLQDFHANKNFILNDMTGTCYINKQDIGPNINVNIRYSKLRKVLTLRA